MPRLSVLISVFLVSLLGWSLWLLPAAPVIHALGQPRLAGAPLLLSDAGGSVWDGQVSWRWQRQHGRVSWRVDWHGLTPGLYLKAQGGDGSLSGWFGVWPGRLEAGDVKLDVAVAPIAALIPRGGADGRVSGDISRCVWQDNSITALAGKLRYSGGGINWGNNGHATVPALDGRLFMKDGGAHGQVTGPKQRVLADASLKQGQLHLRVFRAWPMLLGVSQGGAAGDVVFQVSRPLGTAGK